MYRPVQGLTAWVLVNNKSHSTSTSLSMKLSSDERAINVVIKRTPFDNYVDGDVEIEQPFHCLAIASVSTQLSSDERTIDVDAEQPSLDAIVEW
ncbi:hypothetical protein B296_00019260 [Ensete ventricosum]|uniref:Uncharacterized protein n=1 Tax=Ensete ventricosum TaxID=4639 RepID=A0A426ZAG0_ENSVE|nr:hypothetical protein B296_00019260 [Ensete ventricosum]